ncbi:hypothetical protein [Allonocardiopsis opalescens]|uniref:Uncharacterized protein n=1 Tax=Allonocardiopsis opalescens TaxID=1144618 RepID=A0A2T0PSU2_9ACTN|nr:hypothetical protein [Allonocardiopsis opalescens]PRX91960.1 hypothetical protein CLV72_11233 [Allonocardiopsis opalescens]
MAERIPIDHIHDSAVLTVDLSDATVRGMEVRLTDATRAFLVRLGWTPPSGVALVVSDSPKMIRETLCVAQTRIGNSPLDPDRRREHVERLGRLIAECDRHRPLGADGAHGDLHTPTCGCQETDHVRPR